MIISDNMYIIVTVEIHTISQHLQTVLNKYIYIHNIHTHSHTPTHIPTLPHTYTHCHIHPNTPHTSPYTSPHPHTHTHSLHTTLHPYRYGNYKHFAYKQCDTSLREMSSSELQILTERRQALTHVHNRKCRDMHWFVVPIPVVVVVKIVLYAGVDIHLL